MPAVQLLSKIDRESLPVLWDSDLLLCSKDANALDTDVLGEINVSSVTPHPESAVTYIVEAVLARVQAAPLSCDVWKQSVGKMLIYFKIYARKSTIPIHN